ncbi:uncharacterized protein VTP21DRAFT_7625 [Calcarisporiella thermophila]|uniref:uncharacterized protein n=1 Tax=Calcarisporiella thermophila TaxID=911321 RepID=UPI0037448D5A
MSAARHHLCSRITLSLLTRRFILNNAAPANTRSICSIFHRHRRVYRLSSNHVIQHIHSINTHIPPRNPSEVEKSPLANPEDLNIEDSVRSKEERRRKYNSPEEFWDAYGRMQREGNFTSEFDYDFCCAALQSLKTKRTSQSLRRMRVVFEKYKELLKAGTIVQSDPRPFNIMMHAYHLYGDLAAARNVFDAMKEHAVEPNIVSYNTLMNAITKLGDPEEAIQFFNKLPMPGDVFSYCTLIDACATLKDFKRATEFFERMRREGVQPNAVVFNAIIHICCQQNQLARAMTVLNDMQQQGVDPNDITYATLIRAHSLRGLHSDVEQLLSAMQKAGVTPNADTYIAIGMSPQEVIAELGGDRLKVSDYNSLLSICIKRHHDFSQAFEIFQAMRSHGIAPNVRTYNLLIDANIKSGRREEAFNLFQAMQAEHLEPDVVTYTQLLQTYADTADLRGAMSLFKQMQEKGVKPNIVSFNTLLTISTLQKDFDPEMLRMLHSRMKYHGVALDRRSYNILLAGYAREVSQRALSDIRQTYREMRQAKIPPDHLTFSIMIRAHLAARQPREAMQQYTKMMRWRIRPDADVVNDLMATWSQAGNISQVLSLWHDAKRIGVRLNEESYDIILKACEHHGHTETAKVIARELEDSR